MIGVRDGKLTLRCVWYPSTGAAADGKSLLPLMSKSFIQNSPLQELVYTWRGTFFAHPHHPLLDEMLNQVTALRAHILLSLAKQRTFTSHVIRLFFRWSNARAVLTRSAFLFQPPIY